MDMCQSSYLLIKMTKEPMQRYNRFKELEHTFMVEMLKQI